MGGGTLLRVKDLSVQFRTDAGILKAVDKVSFEIPWGGTVGLVGESGCGKSVTAQAILRLIPPNGEMRGEIILDKGDSDPLDLARLENDGKSIRAIRGKEIAMIFQEPMTCFSPLYTMGNQLREAIRLHRNLKEGEDRALAIELLRSVGIANPEKRIDQYPHEFSGGMRQRVMIAMALSCNPELLIADEPTTALDVTIQAQILELMGHLQRENGMSILFITHDLGVVAEMCQEVCVMYLGKIVERGSVDDIFHNPTHPYTTGLLKSILKIGQKSDADLESIEGVVPVPLNLPPGCGFCDRCDQRIEGLCDSYDVPMAELSAGHWVRCFLHPEVREIHESMVKGSIHG